MATPIPGNQASFRLGELASWTQGSLRGADEALVVRGVGTDTRQGLTGALFVALEGERVDGHQWLAQADAGAVAAVVKRGTPCELPVLEVDDTLVALGQIARGHRLRAVETLPVLALTGSAGKTTTKELCLALAQALWGKVLGTAGNLNNQVGVPMMLLTLDPSVHRAAVLECGTSFRGEIERLGTITQPDVSLVLNADAGHTQGIGSIEAVADEKTTLFRHARRAIVFNTDDAPTARRVLPSSDQRAWSFGRALYAHGRLLERTLLPSGHARVTVALREDRNSAPELQDFELPLLGDVAALDLAAALVAVRALWGESFRPEQWDALRAAIAAVRPVPGRLAPKVHGAHCWLDDSYNANPRSVLASLDTAAELAKIRGGRLLVCLGDMLELGTLAAESHASVLRAAYAHGAVFVGTYGRCFAEAARDLPGPGGGVVGVQAESHEVLAKALQSELKAGDVVLVKGSRGMAMERVLNLLGV